MVFLRATDFAVFVHFLTFKGKEQDSFNFLASFYLGLLRIKFIFYSEREKDGCESFEQN